MSDGPPRRVLVVGSSGSGKTTFARALAVRLGGKHIELDAIYWGPDWSHLDDETFRARVIEATAGDTWVCDGNYRAIRPILLERADTIVWLDLPLRTCLARMLPRTVRRIRSGELLWGGNRESWRQAFVGREALFWWLITQHRRKRRDYSRQFASPEYSGLRVHRFRSSAEADAWLARVSAGGVGAHPATPGVRSRTPKEST